MKLETSCREIQRPRRSSRCFIVYRIMFNETKGKNYTESISRWKRWSSHKELDHAFISGVIDQCSCGNSDVMVPKTNKKAFKQNFVKWPHLWCSCLHFFDFFLYTFVLCFGKYSVILLCVCATAEVWCAP